MRQRAPSVPGVAHGRHDVDGELSGLEGDELNVGDVEDALEVGLLQDEGERAQVRGDVECPVVAELKSDAKKLSLEEPAHVPSLYRDNYSCIIETSRLPAFPPINLTSPSNLANPSKANQPISESLS